MAAEIEGIVVGVDPADLSDNACQLQITPVSDHPRLPREVGEIEPGLYALQFDSTRVHALVRAGSGPLKGEGDAAPTAAEGHPADLHVAEKDHSVGSPVFQGVREHIDIHERAPGLAGAKLPQLSICMTETESRLAGINASPK